MKIIIVRHGQTDWNAKQIVQGQTDIPLNEKGLQQAEQTAEKLKDKKIDIIISSPLLRALKTAEIINKYHNVPIIIKKESIERNFGVLEGTTSKGDRDFRYYHKNTPIEGGESKQEVTKRVFKFLDSLIAEYEEKVDTILLSSHGNVLRCAYWYFEGLPKDDSELRMFDNCEVLEYEV